PVRPDQGPALAVGEQRVLAQHVGPVQGGDIGQPVRPAGARSARTRRPRGGHRRLPEAVGAPMPAAAPVPAGAPVRAGRARRPPGPAVAAGALVSRWASREARAMIVNAGLAEPWVGQTEPSVITTLGTSQIRWSASTSESSGEAPIRAPPMRCA